MRSLFTKPETIRGGRIYVTDKDDIAYLSVVLRMHAGDGLLVSDGLNGCYETIIEEADKDQIVLSILTEHIIEENCKTRITLYQGMPKGSKMDEIVRKSTELGVFRIIPVLTSRTIGRSEEGISASKRERWRRIAEQSARQSRRLRPPEVSGTLTLESATAGLHDGRYDLVLVLFELEDSITLKQALREASDRFGHTDASAVSGKATEIAIFIGPEGGFEQGEIDRLVASGAVSVTVGETILRTETAGPAAVAMVLYELEL